MARNLDPKCRRCRREGEKLFLKGEKCFTDKCSIERRAYAPGQHGQRSSQRLSGYGVQLRESRRSAASTACSSASSARCMPKPTAVGQTGENLLQLLEGRLDAVAYRMGFGFACRGAPGRASQRRAGQWQTRQYSVVCGSSGRRGGELTERARGHLRVKAAPSGPPNRVVSPSGSVDANQARARSRPIGAQRTAPDDQRRPGRGTVLPLSGADPLLVPRKC